MRRRYKLQIKGEELLKKPGAKLILPNHPAQIDAQLIAVIVGKHVNFIPVVTERFVNMPVVGYFLKARKAISVSDLNSGNRDPNVLKHIFSNVKRALDSGETVIIYPSGKVSITPHEVIGNKQSAYEIVSDLHEEARVIGVRIRGLWGSMWSTAWTGQKPHFGKMFLLSIFYVFANLVFFVPKRHVNIEFIDITEEARSQVKTDRWQFNRYLEAFYNNLPSPPANFVKHLFFWPRKKESKQAELK